MGSWNKWRGPAAAGRGAQAVYAAKAHCVGRSARYARKAGDVAGGDGAMQILGRCRRVEAGFSVNGYDRRLDPSVIPAEIVLRVCVA